jgi:predicted lipoprotein with Yx(FWY)xxD motif
MNIFVSLSRFLFLACKMIVPQMSNGNNSSIGALSGMRLARPLLELNYPKQQKEIMMKRTLTCLFGLTALFVLADPWQFTAHGQSAPTPSTTPSSTLSPTESITTRTDSSGVYLASGDGKSLYLFEGDSPDMSTCTGTCTSVWHPFTVPNGQLPKASGQAQSAQIGLIQRADGSVQVTYNHHPLYTYVLDIIAGNTHGNGNSAFGAQWFLVQPNGNALMPSTSPSASPSASP